MTRPGARRPRRAPSSSLRGRGSECDTLDQLIAAARDSRSGVLLVRGDAGVGKTALLDYATAAATGFRVLHAIGVESEMELAFAALHQLCSPLLDRMRRLPAPQRTALETVFGQRVGAPPDRFLVGLAVLSLLAEASGEQPLLCIVDDVQWLDRASAQVLGFAARRLMAEPVALLFGAREPVPELVGLPDLEVTGLGDADARALLAPVFRYVLDDRTRNRIVAETRGNPLALLELPRGIAIEELAGHWSSPKDQPLSRHIEDTFVSRIEDLPEDARLLLLVAAAEPVGDPLLLWRAGEHLGLDVGGASAEEFKALLTIDDRVTFRHPLVRSAVYRAAPMRDRRRVHLALATATDAAVDPDRRAWHLASAALGPDEQVAAELERSAGRAQARGGLAAAAAFLQRSVALTEDTSVRVRRALTASQVSLQAGEFDLAARMLTVAEAGAADNAQQAHALLLRGQIAFAAGHGADAPPLLLAAAKRLEPIDGTLARETYLDAWGAALFAGGSGAPGWIREASAGASVLPPAEPGGPADDLLLGLATLTTTGRMAAAPILRRATAAFGAPEAPVEANFRWGWLSTVPSNVLWDEQSWDTINQRQLDLARSAGALARLPIDLTAQAILVAWRGDFAAASGVIAEIEAVVEVTDTRMAPFGAMLLAALRGREDEATTLFDAAAESAESDGQGIAAQYARWVSAILFNGLGRYEQAFVVAQRAAAEAPELFISAWALPELVEAGVRTDQIAVAAGALDRLAEVAAAADTEWARGIETRSRALVTTGAAAEEHYLAAVAHLTNTRLRPEVARAHLLYGEWLRRQGRRVDGRVQLRAAHELFVTIGMETFAERARRELLATGESVRKRMVTAAVTDELTAQERQIALLVRDGLSNPEVGARLFLSPRTVEWHLRKVFAKLSISSRRQLRDALQGADAVPVPR